MDSRDLVGLIYEAGLDPTFWPQVLDRLAEHFRARAVMLSSQKGTGGFSAVAPRLDAEDLRRYARDWAPRNILRQATARVPAGVVLTSDMVLSDEVYAKSDFYNEFMRPLGLETTMGVNLAGAGCAIIVLAAHRSLAAGRFTTGELRRFAHVARHVERAVRTQMHLARLEAAGHDIAAALHVLRQPVFLLDPGGAVTFANRAAEELLAEPGGMSVGPNGLATADPVETAALRRLVARCAERPYEGRLRLRRADGRSPLVVHVLPVDRRPSWFGEPRRVVLALVVDPERERSEACRDLQREFGLTPAETALAGEILAGRGLSEAARRRGISLTTARTHLAHVFDKTGARRQAELARLLVESRAALRAVSRGP